MTDSSIFAVIPSAGLSQRMGQHKLLMPLQGSPVIFHILNALALNAQTKTGLVACCLTCRQDDKPLQEAVHRWQQETDGALNLHCVVPPNPPGDMRASVQCSLDWITEHYQPAADAGWLLLPADSPLVKAPIINQLIADWLQGEQDILVPTYAGRRGHPTFFRWSLVPQVKQIPYNQGINSLLQHSEVSLVEQPVDSEGIVQDMDTPEDFDRINKKF